MSTHRYIMLSFDPKQLDKFGYEDGLWNGQNLCPDSSFEPEYDFKVYWKVAKHICTYRQIVTLTLHIHGMTVVEIAEAFGDRSHQSVSDMLRRIHKKMSKFFKNYEKNKIKQEKAIKLLHKY